MAYSVTFTTAAAKSIEKLDRALLRRIKAKVLSLAESPRPAGATKLAGHLDLYRVRVGEYRIIYRISDSSSAVEIAIVAHRREVYRGL